VYHAFDSGVNEKTDAYRCDFSKRHTHEILSACLTKASYRSLKQTFRFFVSKCHILKINPTLLEIPWAVLGGAASCCRQRDGRIFVYYVD
jgi:hypothetical protein